MDKNNELPQDPMIDYSKGGVPVSRKLEEEAIPHVKDTPHREGARNDSRSETSVDNSAQPSGNPPDSGFTGGAHNKKRQGTENAQKRSDTGTGL